MSIKRMAPVHLMSVGIAALCLNLGTIGVSKAGSVQSLTAGELFEVCVEGRNQSEAGRDSEDLCHMYLKGYQDAYNADGNGLCLPDGQTSVADMSDAIFRWGATNRAEHDLPATHAISRALACP